MTTGLVLGKFYPLHAGHLELIGFAANRCDKLIVLVCATASETMSGRVRFSWMQNTFFQQPKIHPVLLEYDEQDLPNTSVSSRRVSQIWAGKISGLLDPIDVLFSSEPYGEYLAEYLHCTSITYDLQRNNRNISATEIRNDPVRHWDHLAEKARPFFVQKICVYGTESTGKSTLTERLAAHFKTVFVPEKAREIIAETDQCTEQHLTLIAAAHAGAIVEHIKTANRFLFVDTDINITRSYARFLFNKELPVEPWIDEANHFDLYLFLGNDAPHVQDGTRLDKERRDQLHLCHLDQLKKRDIPFELISGNWEERFLKSVEIIHRRWPSSATL